MTSVEWWFIPRCLVPEGRTSTKHPGCCMGSWIRAGVDCKSTAAIAMLKKNLYMQYLAVEVGSWKEGLNLAEGEDKGWIQKCKPVFVARGYPWTGLAGSSVPGVEAISELKPQPCKREVLHFMRGQCNVCKKVSKKYLFSVETAHVCGAAIASAESRLSFPYFFQLWDIHCLSSALENINMYYILVWIHHLIVWC